MRGFGKVNQASEDMMDLKGIRMLVFEEIGDEIDNNIMKRLTGGGMLTGRRLFKGNESFTLMATIFASFNAKPKLKFKPEGNSELRRLIDMFFRRNFTDTADKVGKKEIKDNIEITWCKADHKYTTKEWGVRIRNGLLNMLMNVYRKYSSGDCGVQFTIPADVQRRIEDFLDAQNIFNSIFDTCYEKVDDGSKCEVKLCDIWDNITFNTEYKELPFKEKRKYNRKYFDEWIEGKASVSPNVDKCKVIKGYKVRDENPVEIENDKTDTEVL
jgi:phage/plasmid-associated DNA primase